jgi:selenide, water dikinase
VPADPRVLAGLGGSEDAGIYLLSEDQALVQTVDFFTPIVDDPRTFGRIAAVNALSDVYAMGGRPITAMNVVGFPSDKLDIAILHEILAGGLDTLREAGVALLGGHSVKDSEPKYGLSVTGLVDPRKMMTNAGLVAGDVLVLTKPIGTGVVGKATKENVATPESIEASETCMLQLNRGACEAAVAHGLRAATDVTGFGLLGHLVEMARESRVSLRVQASAVPLLPGALHYAAAGLLPGGSKNNAKHFGTWVDTAAHVDPILSALLFDAQTAGGLLLAVPADRLGALISDLAAAGALVTAVIGDVVADHDEGQVQVIP